MLIRQSGFQEPGVDGHISDLIFSNPFDIPREGVRVTSSYPAPRGVGGITDM